MRASSSILKVCLSSCVLLLAGCWNPFKSASTPPQAIASPLQAPQPTPPQVQPAPSAPVQVADIQGIVNQMLAAYGPVPLTVQIPVVVHTPECHMGGDPPRFSCQDSFRTVQQPKTTTSLLTAANIRIVQNTNLNFGDAVQTTLPAYISGGSVDVCNPTPTTGSTTAQYSQQIQQTNTVTLTHTVTNTTSATLGGQFQLGGGIALNASVNVGQSNSSSTANLTGVAVTQGLQLSATEQIPAESHYAIEFMVTPTQYSVPFSATVTIDADLSPNDRGIHYLSDIEDQASRTFPVDGSITSSIGLKVNANLEQLQFSPTGCAASTGLVTKSLKIEEGTKIIKP